MFDLNLHGLEDSIPWIMNHADFFVSQCRGSDSVTQLSVWPSAFNGYDSAAWEKVEQAIGNIQALKSLIIFTDEAVPITDWEILTQFLGRVQQKITLNVVPL